MILLVGSSHQICRNTVSTITFDVLNGTLNLTQSQPYCCVFCESLIVNGFSFFSGLGIFRKCMLIWQLFFPITFHVMSLPNMILTCYLYFCILTNFRCFWDASLIYQRFCCAGSGRSTVGRDGIFWSSSAVRENQVSCRSHEKGLHLRCSL